MVWHKKSLEVRMQRSVCYVLVFVLAAAFLAAAQQPQQAPCSAPEYRQFDFWVGQWDASWPASPSSGMKAGRGKNNIEAALDNCVVIEHFDGTPSIPLRGTSVSTFNPRMHKWQQTWVDNEGSYLDFIGEFIDGKMVFTRKAVTRKGKSMLQRMVWKNITPDAFDWSWERSIDGGKSWDVLWPIHYVRKHEAK
jgi:hypothetical protein